MNSGFNCKGLCDRYTLKKRPDYTKGDFYCRICAKAYTQDFLDTVPKINPNYHYCFCCHARVAVKARWKRPVTYYKNCQKLRGYEHLKTFKELGFESIHTEMKNAKIAKQERIKHAKG